LNFFSHSHFYFGGTIHDTDCCIFVLRYIVARYIVTPLHQRHVSYPLCHHNPNCCSLIFAFKHSPCKKWFWQGIVGAV